VKLYVAEAEFNNICEGGNAVIVTRKLTDTLSPGANGPTGIPVTGLYPGKGVPPIITLFASNIAWGGSVSVKSNVDAILPVLLISIE
jgi:hypothetical protein